MSMKTFWVRRKRHELVKWFIRVAYFLSIGILAQLCIQSYLDQQEKNRVLIQMSNLANHFDTLEESMLDLGKKALQIVETIDKKEFHDNIPKSGADTIVENALAGKQPASGVADNSEIIADLIPFKNALNYRQKKSIMLLEALMPLWSQADELLRKRIQTTDRFSMGDSSFKLHHAALNPQRIKDARSYMDMMWTAKEIYSTIDNASISNVHAIKTIRQEN